jgi:nitrite reductase/ring-hydroxylating ferredoxin subunit
MWLRIADFQSEMIGHLNHRKVKGLSIVFGVSNDRPFAFDSSCPHKGGPLEQGELLRDRIRCPWHKYEFDLVTGKVSSIPFPPKYGKWRETGDLHLYRAKLVDGGFYIEL